MPVVDTSFYSTGVPIQLGQLATGYENGLKLKDMQQAQKMNQMKLADMMRGQQFNQAVRDSYTVDPATGQPSLDQTKLAQTAGSIDPQALAALKLQQAQQAKESQLAQIQLHHAQLGDMADMASGIKDQAGYDSFVKDATDKGYLHKGELPGAFDPTVIANIQSKALGYQGQLSEKHKDLEDSFKGKEADAKTAQAAADTVKARTGQSELGIKREDLKLKRAELYGGSGDAPPAPNGQLGGPVDPATLVPHYVPKAHQAKALEEIKDLQNIKSIAQPSIAAFDQAAKEVRPMSGGTSTSLTSFVPGMESPGQKAWQGMANTTVKDVEGTARQAAFDSLEKNFKPQFGDSDATIAQKRAGWINYLKSHSSTPTAKAYGIDLQKYPSTAMGAKELGGIQEHPQDAQAIQWAKTNPKDPRSAAIMKANGL